MTDSWALRGKVLQNDDVNPSLLCRVYDRIAVQNAEGQTAFYCLELSAGNTFNFGFCRKENVPSLLRDVFTFNNQRVLLGKAPALMIPTVPTSIWLKQVRKYDVSNVIMWLENSIELNPEYKETILKLRKMGMKFAIRVDAMGEVGSDDEVLACIDYLLIDYATAAEFMSIVEQLKKRIPDVKTIGFKREMSVVSFNRTEAKNFDFVLGTVASDNYQYKMERPRWQHEMLRTFAQLFSSIYDYKEISSVVASYPLMSNAMKGMVASKHLANLTIKKGSNLADKQGLTQLDIRNFLAIAVAFNLFVLSDKQVCEQNKKPFSLDNVNYEPFIHSLYFGKLVDLFAQNLCDDITAPQAFIAGFLRFAQVMLHDTKEATFDEFPLNAITSCYSESGGQLAVIISVLLALTEHRIDDALNIASDAGVTLNKEDIYGYISHAMTWTDAVERAVGIIKEKREEEE